MIVRFMIFYDRNILRKKNDVGMLVPGVQGTEARYTTHWFTKDKEVR